MMLGGTLEVISLLIVNSVAITAVILVWGKARLSTCLGKGKLW